ncbi:MAG: amylo-alpha-1,6-glucosidase [Chitinophagales bacterium]
MEVRNDLMSFTQPQVSPPEGKMREWLLTNGLGGFASGTVSGINTRRYHGLLIAALKPPADRRLLLAKLEEEIFIDDRKYSLFCSQTLGGYSGHGYHLLHEFHLDPFPRYTFLIEDVFLEKQIIMPRGQNTILVRYQIVNPSHRKIVLDLFPLIACRDYHWTTRRNDWPFTTEPAGTGVRIEAFPGAPGLYLSIDQGQWSYTRYWYYNIFYEMEAFRGLDSVEDLFSPVKFTGEFSDNATLWFGASTEAITLTREWCEENRARTMERVQQLMDSSVVDDVHLRTLAVAADAFMVQRGDNMSVIAGYPWFGDWGRDTMISLPGLTLTTGRHNDFRSVLRSFMTWEKDGLLPNLFPDDSGDPAYNTADASLWVFWSLYKYWQYTRDKGFLEEAYPMLKRILNRYINGTHYGIRMDNDGLITQGEDGKALTWMDARVEGEVITPRRGKTVEINALWYWALTFSSFLAGLLGEKKQAAALGDLSVLTRRSFSDVFWYQAEGYLYDYINGDEKDHSLRCNQVIALSLPSSLLEPNRELDVLRNIWRYLYTPFGLRTLAPDSPGFYGRYTGNQKERDRAYHQGTVWVWPLGHFITAYNRLYGRTRYCREISIKMLRPLLNHLSYQGLGTVSEIFDGASPYYPRGCFAQAWSVAEVIRVLYEEVYQQVDWPDIREL